MQMVIRGHALAQPKSNFCSSVGQGIPSAMADADMGAIAAVLVGTAKLPNTKLRVVRIRKMLRSGKHDFIVLASHILPHGER